MGAFSDDNGRLNLSQERAALAKVQREKATLELEALHRRLIPVEKFVADYGTTVSEYRAKMLALPNRLVAAIDGEETANGKTEAARKLVYESLEVLANAANGNG